MNRKLKKLVLNKEVIAKISDGQMNYLRGGTYLPIDNTRVDTINTDNCPDPPTTLVYCPSKVMDCYSSAGSGCPAETCGVAYTCNGK